MIYTKKGDKGYSSVVNEVSLPKYEQVFELLGNLDELNCTLGIYLNYIKPNTKEYVHIAEMQENLIMLSAYIAGYSKFDFNNNITNLEKLIDMYTKSCKMPDKIIVPGKGGKATAYLHLARSVCRRCERSAVRYIFENNIDSSDGLISYLNRLSDYMYVLAVVYERETENEK